MYVWLLLVSLALGATPGDRAVALATRLVEEVGPRPAYSDEARLAQDWVERELEARGFETERVPGGVPADTVVGCRDGESERILLLLAHTDSVHADCPGAVDNAGSVATLLVAAAQTPSRPPRRVCFAFPGGEELGLVGSRALAESGHFRESELDLVVALDLVGRGEVTWNGLGPAWGYSDLSAFLASSPGDVPWVYRALSQGWPHMERSDHRPFALRGVRTAHLLTRDVHGMFWRYHTALDRPDQLDPYTLERSVEAISRLVDAPPLPMQNRGAPVAVVPATNLVLPAWVIWLLVGLGPVVGAAGAVYGWQKTESWSDLGWAASRAAGAALAAAAAAGLMLTLCSRGRPLAGSLAAPAVLAAWCGWGMVVLAWPWRDHEPLSRVVGVGLSVATVFAVSWVGLPLLAVPAALAAMCIGLSATGRPSFWAIGTLWAPLYLLRPDSMRELAFHGLVPASPTVWSVLWLVLAAPAAMLWTCTPADDRRGAVPVLAAIAIAAVAVCWSTPAWAPPFIERAVLWAD